MSISPVKREFIEPNMSYISKKIVVNISGNNGYVSQEISLRINGGNGYILQEIMDVHHRK